MDMYTGHMSKRPNGSLMEFVMLGVEATTDECLEPYTDKRPTLIYRGRRMNMSRVVWIEATGDNPGPGLICHTCNSKYCINFQHLYLGTKSSNQFDAVAAGQTKLPPVYRGSDHANTKLTDADVLAIRASPLSAPKLAKFYEVGTTTIHRIRRRETWAHLP